MPQTTLHCWFKTVRARPIASTASLTLTKHEPSTWPAECWTIGRWPKTPFKKAWSPLTGLTLNSWEITCQLGSCASSPIPASGDAAAESEPPLIAPPGVEKAPATAPVPTAVLQAQSEGTASAWRCWKGLRHFSASYSWWPWVSNGGSRVRRAKANIEGVDARKIEKGCPPGQFFCLWIIAKYG